MSWRWKKSGEMEENSSLNIEFQRRFGAEIFMESIVKLVAENAKEYPWMCDP